MSGVRVPSLTLSEKMAGNVKKVSICSVRGLVSKLTLYRKTRSGSQRGQPIMGSPKAKPPLRRYFSGQSVVTIGGRDF